MTKPQWKRVNIDEQADRDLLINYWNNLAVVQPKGSFLKIEEEQLETNLSWYDLQLVFRFAGVPKPGKKKWDISEEPFRESEKE